MQSLDYHVYRLRNAVERVIRNYRQTDTTEAQQSYDKVLLQIEKVRQYEITNRLFVSSVRDIMTERMEFLEQQLHRERKLYVLYGNSGVGKSALLNSILGINLLPSTARRARACTQFPCIVSHSDTLRISFTSWTTQEWMSIVEDILLDAKNPQTEDELDTLDENHEDLRGLMSFYQIASGSTKAQIKDIICQQDAPIFPQNTILPSISDITNEFNNAINLPTAIFIKECYISVPLEHWADGEVFVDLPGIDDISRVRTANTRAYRDRATILFLVADITRCLSDSSLRTQFTSSQQYRISRNTDDSITAIVCSRSDSNLDDVDDIITAIAERNRNVKENIGRTLNNSQVTDICFCVSATYYLHVKNIKTILRNPDDDLVAEGTEWTQIPQIIRFIENEAKKSDDKIVELFTNTMHLIDNYCDEVFIRLETETINRRLSGLSQLRTEMMTQVDSLQQIYNDFETNLLRSVTSMTTSKRFVHFLTSGKYRRYVGSGGNGENGGNGGLRWNTYQAFMSREGTFKGQ